LEVTSTPVREGYPGRAGFAFPARASTAYLAVGAAAIAVYFLLGSDAKAVWYVVIGLASVIAVCVGARRLERDRVAWYLFALGLLASVAGDAYSGYYEVHLDRAPPTPSAADVLYLSGYPLLIAGIVILLRGLGRHRTLVALLDSVIATVAVATVQWIFFVDPYLHSSTRLLTRAVNISYPTMDLLLLVALFQLTLGMGARIVAYQLLVVSVLLWVVGDEIYGLSVDNYSAGQWVDFFWLGSYVTWGAAALDPSARKKPVRDRREVPRLTTRRLTLLATALLTIPVLIVILHYWPHHSLHPITLAASAALLTVLVVARFAGLVRAVEGARVAERSANERLRELDRLKDEFVSTISHELRTPLTSISGYVELVREEASAEARGYLDVVDRNAARLLSLVNDLLLVARIQSGEFELDLEQVDLAALVGESTLSAEPQAAKGNVRLSLRDTAKGARVRGDRRRLGQVIDNLLSNAIKFSPEGGEVQLKLGRRDGAVVLEVADAGMGVAEHERTHLFERFFRSQGALELHIPGTGLGLYISKAIVEAHGGRIAAQSVQGQGSSFIVELPMEDR
jgi:signal transduction histidine kinase